MRSTAMIVPTSAVLPPAAAVPVSGCMTPSLYGLACPNACRHGAGTRIVAPSAPAAAAPKPRKLRRVVLPLHQKARVQASSCHRSAMIASYGRRESPLPVVRPGSRRKVPLLSTNWSDLASVAGEDGAGLTGFPTAGLEQSRGDQGPADGLALGRRHRRERWAHVGRRDPAEQDQRLLHAVVHVHERRRVEDAHQRIEPVVDAPSAVQIALAAGLEQLGL